MPFRPATIRGSKVLARCDDSGELVVDGGRVEIRYNPRSDKLYHAAVRNLVVSPDGGMIADAEVASAAPPDPSAGSKKRGAKKKGSVKAHSATTAPPPPPPDAIVAYTDGACSGNPGPAGLGVVLIDGTRVRELSRYLGTATNNVGELAAIGEAADAVQDVERPVHIYTDSTYAIGVLTKGWKAKANQELIAQVKASLQRLSDVTLHYVKGHAGIELNERADGLAVRAVRDRGSTGWREAD